MSTSYVQDTVLDAKHRVVKKEASVPAFEQLENKHNKLVKYIAYQKVTDAMEKNKIAKGFKGKKRSQERGGV